MKITEANASLVVKLDAAQSKLYASNKSIHNPRWMLTASITLSVIAGSIGGYVAAILK